MDKKLTRNQLGAHALYWNNVDTLSQILGAIDGISFFRFNDILEEVVCCIDISCLPDNDISMHKIYNNTYILSYRYFSATITMIDAHDRKWGYEILYPLI